MSGRRRSTRVQISEAKAASLTELEKAEDDESAEVVNKPSRKRARVTVKDESEEASDVMGDPDFGSSEEEEENSSGEKSSTVVGGRLKKKGSAKSLKRPSIHDEDEDVAAPKGDGGDNGSSRGKSKSNETPSIPKKNSIPRRTKFDEQTSTSSLLAHMKPAAPPPPQPTATTSRPSSFSSANRTNPTNRIKLTTDNVKKSPTGPPDISDKAPPSLKSSPQAPPPRRSSNGLGHKKQKILNSIEDVCERLSQSRRFKLPQVESIDLSGSFLRDEEKYDYFDKNERGEIVLQKRVPIFPEDFPPGMREHSLSWWGILDPALGDGKYRPPPRQADPRRLMNGPPPPHPEMPYPPPHARSSPGRGRSWEPPPPRGPPGPPMDHRGPPGPPIDHRGPPGPPMDHRGPPGPPMDHRGPPPPHWRGPPDGPPGPWRPDAGPYGPTQGRMPAPPRDHRWRH